jgi:holo-[acyl-carrier protein] synthase
MAGRNTHHLIEAAFKAFGDDLGDALSWHDFEVKTGDDGTPALELSGRAAEVCKRLGIRRIHLSLSHTRVSASAIVVAEK